MKASDDFTQAFDEAFSKPDLLTSEAFDLWVDLEIVADALAGPMYNILHEGNHDYVYCDTENRFPGVHDRKSFRKWAIELVYKYRNAVLSFDPLSNQQQQDKKVLVAKSEAMLKVVNLSEIEVNRQRST